MIFSSVVATGHHACTPNTINEIPESVDERGMSEGDLEDIHVIGDPAPRENTATSAPVKKRKKGKSKVISSVLEDLAESSKTSVLMFWCFGHYYVCDILLLFFQCNNCC
ncbi:hypothetical protein KSP40_PGU013327 [Platanthera guangdongensis]|uniref:Uncharacterized protein n=1 Tax=Platanthera guangdongensis TaxID=2320717 RepID=A0ABR2LTQ9_9ASPA